MTFRRTFSLLLMTVISLFFFEKSYAQAEHDRIRRITVFPFHVSNDLDQAADTVWWELREKLSESKRFMLASKNFMQAKDVFQPRAELQPADALILGRLLDADALVTVFVVDHKLSMRAYETKHGLTLWSGDIDLHPAIQVSKQLSDAVKKLLYDFMSSFPYQGHVITDAMIGRPSYSEGEKLLFKADVGTGTQITIGDSVQLIHVMIDKIKPVFQEGASIEVYAEGRVVALDKQIITVQVTRRQEGVDITADALVRVPDELRRIREMFGLNESAEKSLSARVVWGAEGELSEEQKEKKPLITSLAWIGNMAIVLLLAL